MPTVAGYSAAPADEADQCRMIYHAFWADGLDISDPAVLADLGCPSSPPTAAMEAWREGWLGLGESGVPPLVLEDGTVSRGLGALRRRADLLPAASG